jgi:hypothetical protein
MVRDGSKNPKGPSRLVVISMRMLFLVGSLSLILTDSTADAQSGSPPKSATSSAAAGTPQTANDQTKPNRTKSSGQERIAEYLAQCLQDWEAATHMTKQEWARVCRRVVDNRAKFRLKEGLVLPELR